MSAPRKLLTTAEQDLAAGRHDLQGVVYMLSGTLPGRADGVSDATFKWATRTFSGALGSFEAYISPPANVLRGQQFLPGDGNSDPGTRIPVRNLEFRGNVSLLAAIDDGVYAWENSTADLRVGYLKPGQGPEDLAAADWTFLVKGGFFGAPDDLEVDGFTLLLYSRSARRNQQFKQPLTPTSGEVFACDRKDLGVPKPVVIGAPDSWYRPPVADLGVRGFTVSGYDAGETVIQFRRITEGTDHADWGSADIETDNVEDWTVGGMEVSGACWYIHRQFPLYQCLGADTVYEQDGDLVTITLVSGLAADVPRGAVVQESTVTRVRLTGELHWQYHWHLAGHPFGSRRQTVPPESDPYHQDDLDGKVGWLLADGSIRMADPGTYNFQMRNDPNGPGTLLNMLEKATSAAPGIYPEGAMPPCYFNPLEADTDVTSQPQFKSTQLLSSKINYPTGGTGTNNANARDGNENSYADIGGDGSITLTFNSAPSPFANDDTTASTLHVMVNGGPMTFKNSVGGVTFGTASGSVGTMQQFRFTQVSARDFNETVLVQGAGFLAELWWEHDLSTEEASTRTQDVVVGASGNVGPILQYADLVFKVPSTKGGVQGLMKDSNGSWTTATAKTVQVWDTNDFSSEIGNASGGTRPYRIPYPTQVMASLQSYFLNSALDEIDQVAYADALVKFQEHDIRLNFVLLEPVRSWTDLEQRMALQSRAHMFYGPSGHQVVFMDVASGITVSGTVQEFRLPGVPATNALRAGRPLLERQGASEIANAVTARYNPDYVEGGEFRDNVEAENAASVALFGERRDPRTGGAYDMWAHSPYRTHPTFNAAASLSGIAQFYADRAAFAVTRFNFDTAWVAHGVDRGSPVGVSYEVAPGEYRRVDCEVEEVGVSPLNSERFTLRCRALGLPTQGLLAFTWAEVFTTLLDTWTDELELGDAWTARWS